MFDKIFIISPKKQEIVGNSFLVSGWIHKNLINNNFLPGIHLLDLDGLDFMGCSNINIDFKNKKGSFFYFYLNINIPNFCYYFITKTNGRIIIHLNYKNSNIFIPVIINNFFKESAEDLVLKKKQIEAIKKVYKYEKSFNEYNKKLKHILKKHEYFIDGGVRVEESKNIRLKLKHLDKKFKDVLAWKGGRCGGQISDFLIEYIVSFIIDIMLDQFKIKDKIKNFISKKLYKNKAGIKIEVNTKKGDCISFFLDPDIKDEFIGNAYVKMENIIHDLKSNAKDENETFYLNFIYDNNLNDWIKKQN